MASDHRLRWTDVRSGRCPSSNLSRVLLVSHRPLVFVSGLTVGDYLLWNWSLNGNHDVLALVSGLTLPPLAVAGLWLLALSLARLIARHTSRPSRELSHQSPSHGEGARSTSTATAGPLEEASSSNRSSGRSSSRIAA
jgi:hypothetical protein